MAKNTHKKPVNTDSDTTNPQDDQGDVEAPMKSKGGKKEKTFSFKTTKSVVFTVNGVREEGTLFTFSSEELMEARKSMLVERFGAGVIEE